MQVLVTTFCSLRESCHKCLFNLFYKCLQVVTSGPVDLRKPAYAYAGLRRLGHVGTGQGHVGTSGVMLGQVRVMFVCDNFLARSLL